MDTWVYQMPGEPKKSKPPFGGSGFPSFLCEMPRKSKNSKPPFGGSGFPGFLCLGLPNVMGPACGVSVITNKLYTIYYYFYYIYLMGLIHFRQCYKLCSMFSHFRTRAKAQARPVVAGPIDH